MDSPEKQPTPPLPVRGGGRGHPPSRHALEDGGGHFPHGQRRTLLPTQKLTFHNTRPHDMAQQHGHTHRIADRGCPRPPGHRRGGFLSASPTGWSDDRRRIDQVEFDSLSDQANRDPRLQRKVSQSSMSMQASLVKRKPNIDLQVHQILSEHCYCRGRSEGDPALDELFEKILSHAESRTMDTNKTILPSTFLSYVERRDTVPVSSLKTRTRLAKKAVIPDKVKPPELPVDEIPDHSKLIGSCSSHQMQLNFFCKTCRELICEKCAGDSHLNHDHYVLNKVLGGPKSSASLKAIAVELKALASELQGGTEVKSDDSKEIKSEESELMETMEEKVRGKVEEDEDEDSTVISLAGFELDLDTEPSSSEDEGMEDEGAANSYIISLPSRWSYSEGTYSVAGASSQVFGPSSEPCRENYFSLKKSLAAKLPGEMQLPQWSITNFDPTKNLMRFSKVDLVRGSGPFHGVLNGQVVPKKLALFASNSSPSGSGRTESPPRRDWDSAEGTHWRSDREGDLESCSSSVETFVEGCSSSFDHPYHVGDRGRGVAMGEEGGCLMRKRRRRWENMRVSGRTRKSVGTTVL